MTNTDQEKFLSLWTDFIALVKGKLIRSVAKQRLSQPLANMILSDAASSWESEYEINGKWLISLQETNPQQAQLVREVLLKDLHFDKVKDYKELPGYCNYIFPFIGGCAGYAISSHWECGKAIQALSMLIPAALIYPAVNRVRNNINETNKEKLIQEYMAQLDKYKNSIVSILS